MKSSVFVLVFILFNSFSVYAQDSADKVADNNENLTAEQALVRTATEFGDVSGTQKYKITCVSGKDSREITVITQEDNSVGVVYKKFDTVKTMAIAQNDPTYADQVADKIKVNLEGAGFTCTKE